MNKFTNKTTRDELELFFAMTRENEKYVRFLFIELSKTQGEIRVANQLLERVNAGDFVNIKCDAYELGYGI